MRFLWLLVASVPLAGLGLDARPEQSGPVDPDPCPRQETASYAGVNTCKTCHFAQFNSWKKTAMAKSFETLKPGQKADVKKKFNLDPEKDYTKDPSCLPCHTTGYGQPGGYPKFDPGVQWSEEEKTRAEGMQGVQCESCHGPGSLTSPHKKANEQYKKEDLIKLGMIEPDAANCKSCHNPKSPTIAPDAPFDYEKLIKDPEKIHKHVPLKFKH